MNIITDQRRKKLQRNFKLVFFINALYSTWIINLIATLFYIGRGFSLSEIYLTAIIFSACTLLFEIPSSYFADKIGRKPTLMIAILLAITAMIVQINAHSLFILLISFAIHSASYAFLSGTDEALIYDTNKELNNGNNQQILGRYSSSKRFFKILTPIIAALIAKDLTELQFLLIYKIQILILFSSLILSIFITEAKHKLDLIKNEAEVFLDAFHLIRKDKMFIKAIISKSGLFIASFVFWRIHQDYYVNMGITIITLAIFTSTYQLASFLSNYNSEKFLKSKTTKQKINLLNLLFIILLIIFILLNIFLPNPYILLIFGGSLIFIETTRTPFFSEYFNKRSNSYNRATTLSLTNLLQNLLQILVLIFASYLANFSIIYIFILMLITAVMTVTIFRFR